MSKNVFIFTVHMRYQCTLRVRIKDILILVKDPTQGLDDNGLSTQAQYSINFLRSNTKFCSSLHHNGDKTFLVVNFTKFINSNQKIQN